MMDWRMDWRAPQTACKRWQTMAVEEWLTLAWRLAGWRWSVLMPISCTDDARCDAMVTLATIQKEPVTAEDLAAKIEDFLGSIAAMKQI